MSTEAAFRGVFRKRSSENMQQVYRKIPMTKSDFTKVALLTLRHGCSPVNLPIFSEHLFLITPLECCFCMYNYIIHNI